MRTYRSVALAVLGLTVVVLVFGVATRVNNPHSSAISARQLRDTVASYQLRGLLNHPFLSDPALTFRRSRATLDYSGQKTIAQVKAELKLQKAQLEVKRDDVEQALSFHDYVGATAASMTRRSTFQGRVTVNQVPRHGHLNLVFLRADPDHLFKGFEVNLCAYVGMNTILCNANKVAYALREFEGTAENLTTAIAISASDGSLTVSALHNLDVFRQLLKQNFLNWLLGHEIGHAVLHSKEINADLNALHFDLVYDGREKEADLFVIRAVGMDSAMEAAFAVILLEYIAQKFHDVYIRQYGTAPLIFPAMKTPKESIVLDSSQLDMRLLVRALRVMDEALMQNPKALEQATYSVIDGQLAYVGSYKAVDYYRFIHSRIRIANFP